MGALCTYIHQLLKQFVALDAIYQKLSIQCSESWSVGMGECTKHGVLWPLPVSNIRSNLVFVDEQCLK